METWPEVISVLEGPKAWLHSMFLPHITCGYAHKNWCYFMGYEYFIFHILKNTVFTRFRIVHLGPESAAASRDRCGLVESNLSWRPCGPGKASVRALLIDRSIFHTLILWCADEVDVGHDPAPRISGPYRPLYQPSDTFLIFLGSFLYRVTIFQRYV